MEGRRLEDSSCQREDERSYVDGKGENEYMGKKTGQLMHGEHVEKKALTRLIHNAVEYKQELGHVF